MSETVVIIEPVATSNISVNISPETEAINVIVEETTTPETTLVLSNEQGPQGIKGDTGATGPSNVLSIGTVVGGATAAATITGTSPTQILNLTLPTGATGATGPQGPTGATGATGATGTAATITVGTTTTGSPGSSASVTNSGTSSAAVFNFTIPGASGVVAGGTAGQALTKVDSTDYNTQWTTIPLLNTANTFTGGVQQITTASAGTIGLIIRGSASQTADLTQYQGSTGTVLAKINPSGFYFGPGLRDINNNGAYLNLTASGTVLISTQSTTIIPLTVKAIASQTVNLQEWQNSGGTVLAYVNQTGQFSPARIIMPTGEQIQNVAGTMALQFNTAGLTALIVNTAAVGLIIKGAASQTADLQQWQDSTGAVRTKIDSVGHIRGQRASFANGTSWFDDATLNISPYLTNVAGVIVRGLASQTANLQEWQNSAGSILVRITAAGDYQVGGTIAINASRDMAPRLLYVNGAATSASANVLTTAAVVGMIIRGAASQTADLTQWQDSAGTVLANITSGGNLVFTQAGNNITTPAAGRLNIGGAVSGTGYFGTINVSGENGGYAIDARGNTATGSTGARIRSGNAANVALVVSSESGQTADLQTWNSTTAVVANVTSAGYVNGSAYRQIGGNSNAFGSGTISSVLTAFGTGGNAAVIPIVVRGAASQTANLTEWQNSSGTANVFISMNANQNANFNSTSFAYFTSHNATTTPMLVRGFASQTANLQEWQDSSGTMLSNIDAYGRLRIRSTTTSAYSAAIGAASAGTVGLLVQGTASQTANLQEWQNSSGTILSFVRSDGYFRLDQGFQFGTMYSATAKWNVNGGNSFLLTGQDSTLQPLIVKTAASQSANIFELQNSSGTILDSFDNAGNQRSQTQLIQYGAEGSVLQNIPNRVHPAETLLKQAVWWIDSAHSGSSGQAIRNLGWGGSALDATAGSTTSADSNDPLYLAWDGINYAYLPGVVSNFLSVPDATPLDITGDIDIRVQLTMDDWTPSSPMSFLGKWTSTGNQRSYLLALTNVGQMQFYWSVDGINLLSATSSAAISFADGQLAWVRATLDVDNGASGKDIKFFTSADGITWTQLGTTQTTAGTTSIFAGTGIVEIGSQSNTWNLAGKIYRAQILNGIDGVPVLDADTSQVTSGSATSFTALTGQTVTINRSTSGRKTTCVTHPVWLFGTDDFMEVNNRWLERTTANYLYLPGVASNFASSPDSAALDITGDIDLRVKVAMDDWTPASNQSLICKSSGSSNISYRFFLRSDGLLQLNWSADGTAAGIAGIASTAVTGVADGAIKWVRVTFDVDNGASGKTVTFFTSDDGTTWTQLGTAVTQAGTTSIFAGTASQEIGSRDSGTGEIARGKFFRAQVLNGIGGTVAFDANFETGITSNLPTTFTESSANAATVTINYSGTGYRSAGVIASTYVFPGNPNTFKLSQTSLLDFGATDSFTLVAVARQFATPNSYGVFFEKTQLPPYNGYSFTQQATSFRPEITIRDGVNTATNSSATPNSVAGAVTAYSMVVDRSAQTLYFNVNGTSSATTSTSAIGNISSYYPLAIGRRTYTPGLYNDMEFVAGAVFRRALTAAEFATLTSYFQGRVA